MTYEYSFDDTVAGNLTLRRERYQLIQESLNLLLKEVQRWNRTALEHGASRKPYESEETDLSEMIEWGEERLGDSTGSMIVVHGISVGSWRYIKGALLLAIRRKEEDLSEKTTQGWPDGVVSALRERITDLMSMADKISFEPSDMLWELIPREAIEEGVKKPSQGEWQMEWDVFISHASEDKKVFVRDLASALVSAGLRVWYDEFTLKIGDSLRRSIDRGLAHSRYGIVVVSPDFLRKEWPQKELDGLAALEVNGRKVILPVWHEINAEDVRKHSPTLADRVATSSEKGLNQVVADLLDAMGLETRKREGGGVGVKFMGARLEENTRGRRQKEFNKVMAKMSDLIREMKQDLSKEGDQFTREFFLLSRKWAFNPAGKCFVYYFEDHEELQGKVHVLENNGWVGDVTSGNTKKYRMTEEFVELVLTS